MDVLLDKEIREAFPEVDVPLSMILNIKNPTRMLAKANSSARVKVPIDGKPRKIEIGKQVGNV